MTTDPSLPPGQIETKRFPVVGERSPSAELAHPFDWALSIEGLVEQPFRIGFDDLLDYDQRELTFDVHCVTSWTRFDSTFTGVPLSDLLERALPGDEAHFVSFTAYSVHDHHTSLPLTVARESSWVVHSFEGKPLSIEHGGPVRVVTPGRYFYKSTKWVRTVELLAEDRVGWWETNSSYHNNADPWAGDERFVTGSLRPSQLDAFLRARNYDKYRGRVMIGLDLRSWAPASRDLRRLRLKNCDLRGVDLARSDLRNVNLSLSDLSACDLRGADLSGSDLEGADFTGADLREADLSGTALSATRFERARVEGTNFNGSWGLLEDQRDYLLVEGTDPGS